MLKQKETDFPSDLNKKLNVACINMCTEAEGPYKRMAIWFQGCSILCDGCCNPEFQPLKIAHIMTVKEIVDAVIKADKEYGIEGVTFLGGEPTLQENLIILSKKIKELGLGIILFTGNLIEQLDTDLIRSTDLIIDGKFDKNQIDTARNLIGSKNQKVYFITERYKSDHEWFSKLRNKLIEVNMGEKSNALFTGDVF